LKQGTDSFTYDMFADTVSQSCTNEPSAAAHIVAYTSDEDMSRLHWWEDPARAEMRAAPPWMMVYAHIKMAALMSKALSDACRSKSRAVISSLPGHVERLQWFLENHPGFREEWKSIEAIRRKAEVLLAQASSDRRRAYEIYSQRRAHDSIGGVV